MSSYIEVRVRWRRNDSVVTVGGCCASQHQVRQTQGDLGTIEGKDYDI